MDPRFRACEEISGAGLRAGVSAKPKAEHFRHFVAEAGTEARPTKKHFFTGSCAGMTRMKQ